MPYDFMHSKTVLFSNYDHQFYYEQKYHLNMWHSVNSNQNFLNFFLENWKITDIPNDSLVTLKIPFIIFEVQILEVGSSVGSYK